MVVIQGLRGLGLEDPCKNKGRLKIHMSKKKNEGDEGRDEERRKGGRKKGRQKIAFVNNLTPC